MLELMPQLIEDGEKAAASPLWPLADADLLDCLSAAHHLEQLAIAAKLRLIHEAVERGIPAGQGHRSTTGWLRTRLLLDPGPARELSEQAEAVARHPAVLAAMIDGTLDARQAVVVASTVDGLPVAIADAAQTSASSLDGADDGSAGADPDDLEAALSAASTDTHRPSGAAGAQSDVDAAVPRSPSEADGRRTGSGPDVGGAKPAGRHDRRGSPIDNASACA